MLGSLQRRLVETHDVHCRGLLLGSDAPPDGTAGTLVRGFIAGGSMLEAVAAEWLAGRLSDESLIGEIADRFHARISGWPRAGEGKRS